MEVSPSRSMWGVRCIGSLFSQQREIVTFRRICSEFVLQMAVSLGPRKNWEHKGPLTISSVRVTAAGHLNQKPLVPQPYVQAQLTAPVERSRHQLGHQGWILSLGTCFRQPSASVPVSQSLSARVEAALQGNKV